MFLHTHRAPCLFSVTDSPLFALQDTLDHLVSCGMTLHEGSFCLSEAAFSLDQVDRVKAELENRTHRIPHGLEVIRGLQGALDDAVPALLLYTDLAERLKDKPDWRVSLDGQTLSLAWIGSVPPWLDSPFSEGLGDVLMGLPDVHDTGEDDEKEWVSWQKHAMEGPQWDRLVGWHRRHSAEGMAVFAASFSAQAFATPLSSLLPPLVETAFSEISFLTSMGDAFWSRMEEAKNIHPEWAAVQERYVLSRCLAPMPTPIVGPSPS
jgi:hypothetical protein